MREQTTLSNCTQASARAIRVLKCADADQLPQDLTDHLLSQLVDSLRGMASNLCVELLLFLPLLTPDVDRDKLHLTRREVLTAAITLHSVLRGM